MNQEPDEESFPRNIGLGIYWRLGHPPSDFAEAVPDAAPGKTFAGIGEDDCRWAIGEDADGAHRFCGCPRHRPSFYCASHLAVSVVPDPEVKMPARIIQFPWFRGENRNAIIRERRALEAA